MMEHVAGRRTRASEVQPLKALRPMAARPSGSVTLRREAQQPKAKSPRCAMLLLPEKATEEREPQL